MPTTKHRANPTAARDEAPDAFTDDEREAMRDRAKELKAARRGASKADEEAAVRAKIAELDEPDRSMAERLHALITATAPELAPRLWYGMPAYARDGKVLCFLTPAQKFKARYATLGFNDDARLDDGGMWPTAFALTRLTAEEETAIAALIRKALG